MTKYALLLVLSSITVSCGLDSGDKTNTAVPTTEEQETLALVASEQLEETLAAAGDNQGTTAAENTSLSLAESHSCEVQSDSTVVTSSAFNVSRTVNIPARAPVRSIATNSDIEINATLRSTDPGLNCGPLKRYASFNWQNLTTFHAEVTSNRNTQKTITDTTSGEVKETLSVVADGNRQVTWQKTAITNNTINLTKTVNFQSNLNRTTTRSGTTSSYLAAVETLESLEISQTIESRTLKSFVIDKGSVISDFNTDRKTILTYNKLEFVKGSTCYPQSGSISASVYNKADLKTALFTYSIVFNAGTATLVFADQSSKELDLSDCSITN